AKADEQHDEDLAHQPRELRSRCRRRGDEVPREILGLGEEGQPGGVGHQHEQREQESERGGRVDEQPGRESDGPIEDRGSFEPPRRVGTKPPAKTAGDRVEDRADEMEEHGQSFSGQVGRKGMTALHSAASWTSTFSSGDHFPGSSG
ncbi:hypothetical protein OY671_010148, partial [Metschnikowia pulcherrima]